MDQIGSLFCMFAGLSKNQTQYILTGKLMIKVKGGHLFFSLKNLNISFFRRFKQVIGYAFKY